MVYACAALESMAVRLACAKATEAQLGALRASFRALYEADPTGQYHRYFEARWQFCRHAATLAQCAEILSMLNHLLLHLRSVHETIFRQSIDLAYLRAAYRAIIEALELRDAELASRSFSKEASGLLVISRTAAIVSELRKPWPDAFAASAVTEPMLTDVLPVSWRRIRIVCPSQAPDRNEPPHFLSDLVPDLL